MLKQACGIIHARHAIRQGVPFLINLNLNLPRRDRRLMSADATVVQRPTEQDTEQKEPGVVDSDQESQKKGAEKEKGKGEGASAKSEQRKQNGEGGQQGTLRSDSEGALDQATKPLVAPQSANASKPKDKSQSSNAGSQHQTKGKAKSQPTPADRIQAVRKSKWATDPSPAPISDSGQSTSGSKTTTERQTQKQKQIRKPELERNRTPRPTTTSPTSNQGNKKTGNAPSSSPRSTSKSKLTDQERNKLLCMMGEEKLKEYEAYLNNMVKADGPPARAAISEMPGSRNKTESMASKAKPKETTKKPEGATRSKSQVSSSSNTTTKKKPLPHSRYASHLLPFPSETHAKRSLARLRRDPRNLSVPEAEARLGMVSGLYSSRLFASTSRRRVERSGRGGEKTQTRKGVEKGKLVGMGKVGRKDSFRQVWSDLVPAFVPVDGRRTGEAVVGTSVS